MVEHHAITVQSFCKRRKGRTTSGLVIHEDQGGALPLRQHAGRGTQNDMIDCM